MHTDLPNHLTMKYEKVVEYLEIVANNESDLQQLLDCLAFFHKNGTFTKTGRNFSSSHVAASVALYFRNYNLCYDVIEINNFTSEIPRNMVYYEHKGFCVVVPMIGDYNKHAQQFIDDYIRRRSGRFLAKSARSC